MLNDSPGPGPGGRPAARPGACRHAAGGRPGDRGRFPPASPSPLWSASPCPPRPRSVVSYLARDGTSAGSPTSSPVPDLTQIQTRSYERFLQADLPVDQRGDAGLEGVFREIFPIESYDKTLKLEYLNYDLGKPRYDPDECRQLRLTYGRPLHVWLRLNKGETTLEESVYLGDMPIMIGGGEFIINGAERVVVSQLHRSPGRRLRRRDRGRATSKLHACRVIPERGSWIELQVTKKDTLGVRIDQSGKFSSMTLLRAMSPQYSTDEAILQAFYEVEEIDSADPKAAAKLEGRIACGDMVDPATGEVLIDSGTTISKPSAQVLADAGNLGTIHVLKEAHDPLILQSLQEDPTSDHESALLRIYQRLRPGNPPQLEKARELFHEKFFDTNRYRLGKVGRFRINRKFNQDDPRRPDDARPRGLRQRHPLHPQPAAAARGTSTTSTTWATAGCGPSTSWPPTSSARASSSSAAPSRSG